MCLMVARLAANHRLDAFLALPTAEGFFSTLTELSLSLVGGIRSAVEDTWLQEALDNVQVWELCDAM